MNCESGEEPKNSLIAAVTGRILMSELGESDSISCDWVVILSLTTLSRREKPILNWF